MPDLSILQETEKAYKKGQVKKRLYYEDQTTVISFSYRRTECHRKFSLISHLHTSSRAAHRGLKRPRSLWNLARSISLHHQTAKRDSCDPGQKYHLHPGLMGIHENRLPEGFSNCEDRLSSPDFTSFIQFLAFVLQKSSSPEQVL